MATGVSEARGSGGRLARVAFVAGAVLPRSEARTQWQVGGWLARQREVAAMVGIERR